MKNTRRFIRNNGMIKLLAYALACLFLVCGCGAELPVAQASPTPLVLPEATPEPIPVQGGMLIMPISRNPFVNDSQTAPLLNPLVINTEEMRNFYSLIYEPFLRLDANNRIVPSLAEKWSYDDTGLVWTFTLRQGVQWHVGGGMLTADDVIFTLEQIRFLGNESYYYSAINAAVNSWEKVDDRTIRITFRQKGMQVLYALVFPVLCSQDSTPLNGTGPYCYVSQTEESGETVVDLGANQRWWKQSPYIETVRCLARENNQVALDGYEAGLLNFVPTNSIAAGKYRETDVTNVMDVMSQEAEMILVNHRNPALMDLNVRKAIAQAIDRSSIISNIYMNHAALANVPVPLDSYLYASLPQMYDYSLEGAKTLLSEAGWEDVDSDGVREKSGYRLALTLLVNESTENTLRKSAAVLVEAQLERVGFDVTVETAKFALGADDSDFQTRLKNGAFDLAMVGFELEPSGNLSAYLRSNGTHNYGGYNSPRMDQFLLTAAFAQDDATLRKDMEAIQQCFLEELPFIMLYFRLNDLVYSNNIKGVGDIRDNDILRTVEKWYMQVGE